MLFRDVFCRHSVSTHHLKKTHLAFTLVLVGCLLFSFAPAAPGFIAWEHQDFPNLDTLIKKVHDKHWVIHYSYADNCPTGGEEQRCCIDGGDEQSLADVVATVAGLHEEAYRR